MPGQRKLFIAHASELAYRCVRAVQSNGLVANFVRSYAERYNRSGLFSNPERNRELDSTIGREALLVMAAKVSRMLPAAFGRVRASDREARSVKHTQDIPYLGPEEAAVAQAFYAEFLASLGRSLEWSPAEAVAEATAFGRDLEMYQRWSGRSESQIATQLNPQFDLRFAQRINQKFSANPNSTWETVEEQYSAAPIPADHFGSPGAGKSPFPDRCALLLDPSLMDQARKAAAEFETEIARAAGRMFSQLGRQASTRKKFARKPASARRPTQSRSASRPRRPANSSTVRSAKASKPQRAPKQKTASRNCRRKKPARAPKQKSRPLNRRKRKP